MMRILLCITILTIFHIPSQGQDMKDIFEPNTKITWLGLDFSRAKLLGDRERLGSADDIGKLVAAWNDLIFDEKYKFDIATAIDKVTVTQDFEPTKSHNAKLNFSEMPSLDARDEVHLRPGMIDEIVAGYDFGHRNGIGVMFIVESFSKPSEKARAWLTFVNMKTKEVFFSEPLMAEPSGGGLRNYWANAIYKMIKQVDKREFEMWRKKYYRK